MSPPPHRQPAATPSGPRHAGLEEVRSRIAAAASAAGRSGAEIKLVVVSKTFAAERIAAVLDAGQRIFGENRVQEAKEKWPRLKARYPDTELHLVGPLQTNKAKDAVALFDCIETVDRPKLAAALAREIERQGRRPSLFVQVNTGAEPQKAGVPPEEADALIEFCRRDLALGVDGLMCIPPLDQEPEPHFVLLVEIARRNGVAWLSMGMSADFETAIACGATHVRIGTAIFGERQAADG